MFNRIEATYLMLSRHINIEHDVSVLGMFRLDDTDNILISRLDAIWKYHDMLLTRLSNSDKKNLKIHLRPNLLNADMERYLPFLEQGADLVVWQSDPVQKLKRHEKLTQVRVTRTTNRTEGFLVINTPSASRVLAAWQDANNRVFGVLVTNPATVETVTGQLDVLIRSSPGGSGYLAK